MYKRSCEIDSVSKFRSFGVLCLTKKSKKKRDKSPDALELLEDILETRKKKSKKSKSSDEEGGRKRRKKKHRHKHSSNSDSDSNNSNSDLKKAWEEIKMKWEKKLKKKVVSESE